MDITLVFAILLGFLFGAGITAIGLLWYSAHKIKTEKQKLEQELTSKLTHEFNSEKKEISRKFQVESNQARFGRQRLVKKLDEKIAKLRTSSNEIETQTYKIRDIENALSQAKANLKVAQSDHTDLQTAHQQLASDHRTQQVRLELAETHDEEIQKHIDMLRQQLDQKTKTQDALLFATNQLRETLAANQKLEQRLAYKEEAPKGQVGLGFKGVEGLEPVHAIRLFEAGIHTPAAMREHPPQEVAAIAGVEPQKAIEWINLGNGQSN